MRNAMFFLCCLLVSSNALSQTKMPELLQRIHRQLSAAEHISYQYTVEQRLDDGQQNRVKGTLSRAKDYLAEINPEQTIIQTAQWYYKLDHGSKSIFIVDVDKVKKQLYRNKVPAEPMAIVPDSLIMKYGKVDVKTVGQVAKIHIRFSSELLIRSVYLEYDLKGMMPLMYKVEMRVMYGIDGWSYEERYMDQVFTAKNFSFRPVKQERTEDYFSYSGGKISLKKYPNYRVIKDI